MRLKKLVSFVASAALVVSTLIGGQVQTTGANAASTSTFEDLSQSEIVSEMGVGWNLGNQLEANSNGTPNETAWGNPTITENLIKAVKAQGFDTIRVPVSYLSYIGSDSNYTINSSWLNRVQEVVDMCIDNDLYVIINIHGDGYNSVSGGWLLCNGSDQTTIRAKYKAVWKQIANKFINYDEHLIFESMNEEFDGTYGTPNSTYYSNINALNQIFVDTVRQTGGNNASRWLMLPGWNTNIDYTAGDYGFSIPTDNYRSSSISSSEKRIMISVHYYDPWDFCGAESSTVTQWGSSATDSSKVASYGDESYMNSQLYKLYSSFTSQGYPVVIGEFGAIDKTAYDSTNATCRNEWAKKFCTYSKKYGCVPVWWDNGDTNTYGFALFNRNTYAVTQSDVISAMMSVYGSSSGSSTSTVMNFSANNLTYGSYTSNITSGDFTIGASSSKNVFVQATSETVNGTAYSLKLKMNGAGNSTGRYIKFTTDGAATIDITAASTTSGKTRTIRVAKDSVGGTTAGDVTVESTASKETVSVSEAGTYYVYSTNSGIYVYDVTVTVSGTTGTNISFSANDLTTGTYTSNFTSGDFTVGASSSKYAVVRSASATVGGTYFSKLLNLNGGGNSSGRYIKFTTTGACTVTVKAASTSTSATRTIRLAKDSVGGTTVADNSVSSANSLSYNVSSAGTYYLYSTSCGINVYSVDVAY